MNCISTSYCMAHIIVIIVMFLLFLPPPPPPPPLHFRMLSSTPAAKYDQRQNRGAVVCSLNDTALPRMWRGTGAKISLDHYDEDTALKSPYQFMFQKVSEKALSKFTCTCTFILRREGGRSKRESKTHASMLFRHPFLVDSTFTCTH